MKKLLLVPAIISLLSKPCFAISDAEYSSIKNYIEQQNIEMAFSELKKAQAGNSKLTGKALLSLGQIYLELEQPSKSFDYYEKVLFASTELDAEARAGMSLASIRLGNIQKAKQYSTEALNINPDLVLGKVAYALAHQDDLSKEEIAKIFESSIAASGRSTFAGRKYVELLLRKNQIVQAEKVLREILIKNQSDAPSLALYSEIFWVRGDTNNAIKFRTDAEAAYRNAGNNIKADEMVAWLNFEALPSAKAIEQKKVVPELKIESESEEKSEAQPVSNNTVITSSDDANLAPNRELFEPRSKPQDMPLDLDKGFFTGSGSILANGHLILTNKHVVEDVDYIVVRNGLGETRIAESFVVSETDDLALIKLTQPFPAAYSLSLSDFQQAQTGQDVFVMGYPMAFTLGMFHPSITAGIVTNEAGFGETSGEFQISAVVNPGNSGGPIFNKLGHVIGVATGGIDKKFVLEEDGFIPDGVNYGVSTDRILDFLEQDSQGVANNAYTYDAASLYKYMRSAVVFIVGQKN